MTYHVSGRGGLTYFLGVPSADRPLVWLPNAQAGKWNIANLSQPNPGLSRNGSPCTRPVPGRHLAQTNLIGLKGAHERQAALRREKCILSHRNNIGSDAASKAFAQ